jgi:hypothetical protein
MKATTDLEKQVLEEHKTLYRAILAVYSEIAEYDMDTVKVTAKAHDKECILVRFPANHILEYIEREVARIERFFETYEVKVPRWEDE